MEPGVDLDIEIARTLWKVFVVRDCDDRDYLVSEQTGESLPIPRFSTELSEANRVVALMKEKGFIFQTSLDAARGLYHVCFLKNDGCKYRYSSTTSLPHSICLAALAAIGGNNVFV